MRCLGCIPTAHSTILQDSVDNYDQSLLGQRRVASDLLSGKGTYEYVFARYRIVRRPSGRKQANDLFISMRGGNHCLGAEQTLRRINFRHMNSRLGTLEDK